MTIKKANNELQRIDNSIEYYLRKKELEESKMQPKAVDTTKMVVDGGKRVDRYSNYVITIEEIDKKIDELYAEKKILEDYIEKELIRLGKYKEVEQLIIYYKEQCLENYTWLQISQKVHYSVIQCKRIYKKWKGKRVCDDEKFENIH